MGIFAVDIGDYTDTTHFNKGMILQAVIFGSGHEPIQDFMEYHKAGVIQLPVFFEKNPKMLNVYIP